MYIKTLIIIVLLSNVVISTSGQERAYYRSLLTELRSIELERTSDRDNIVERIDEELPSIKDQGTRKKYEDFRTELLNIEFLPSNPEVLSKRNAREEYCMILARAKILSTKLTIDIDFGQEWSFFKDKRGLRDKNGKKIIFNSVIDALNYMAADGWEFVNAYAITVGNQNVYHYVMKRELTAINAIHEN